MTVREDMARPNLSRLALVFVVPIAGFCGLIGQGGHRK